MEKFVAFGLYRKNELGGHQPAQLPPPQGSEVYLASDVETLIELVREVIKEDIGQHIMGTDWHDKAKSLMVTGVGK
jgi:hypothetical protein